MSWGFFKRISQSASGRGLVRTLNFGTSNLPAPLGVGYDLAIPWSTQKILLHVSLFLRLWRKEVDTVLKWEHIWLFLLFFEIVVILSLSPPNIRGGTEMLTVRELRTLYEGDQKAPFSIATTPRCRGGCYSFPWIAQLHPWYVSVYCWVLSKDVSNNIFKVFGMTRPEIEHLI